MFPRGCAYFVALLCALLPHVALLRLNTSANGIFYHFSSSEATQFFSILDYSRSIESLVKLLSTERYSLYADYKGSKLDKQQSQDVFDGAFHDEDLQKLLLPMELASNNEHLASLITHQLSRYDPDLIFPGKSFMPWNDPRFLMLYQRLYEFPNRCATQELGLLGLHKVFFEEIEGQDWRFSGTERPITHPLLYYIVAFFHAPQNHFIVPERKVDPDIQISMEMISEGNAALYLVLNLVDIIRRQKMKKSLKAFWEASLLDIVVKNIPQAKEDDATFRDTCHKLLVQFLTFYDIEDFPHFPLDFLLAHAGHLAIKIRQLSLKPKIEYLNRKFPTLPCLHGSFDDHLTNWRNFIRTRMPRPLEMPNYLEPITWDDFLRWWSNYGYNTCLHAIPIPEKFAHPIRISGHERVETCSNRNYLLDILERYLIFNHSAILQDENAFTSLISRAFIRVIICSLYYGRKLLFFKHTFLFKILLSHHLNTKFSEILRTKLLKYCFLGTFLPRSRVQIQQSVPATRISSFGTIAGLMSLLLVVISFYFRAFVYDGMH